MQTVALIDYGSGNLHSAAKAIERAAREGEVAIDLVQTDDPTAVYEADRIVLPGVGAFGDCMDSLAAIDGMVEALNARVRQEAAPFLGICVGMQLMAATGEEHGTHAGLGWIDARVTALAPDNPALKIPHMGWNALSIAAPHPVLDGISTGDHVYFVHSYHMTGETGAIAAQTEYGGAVTACVQSETCFGTQFHPEKSQNVGLRLLRNFLIWTP
ncbi:MAG: imidazole glycerol phosphate synthase subunit HisH [Sphingomonadales bacterium]